jgi:nucleoside-diphosphate-sugar epimerase
MTIPKVLVTGGDGRIGQVTVQTLRESGYDVTVADKHPRQPWGTQEVNFEDLGQVIGVMQGHDAILHLAAIPNPMRHTAEIVFRTNVMATFNVLEAATTLGIKNVVLASSLSALGYAFMQRHFNPVRIPIDEEHPLLSQDTYGLSKMVGEELAEGFWRRTPDMSLVSLRFTTVLDDMTRDFMERWRQGDSMVNGAFWTYIDVRDAARACQLALEYKAPGHEAFYISAPQHYAIEPIEVMLRQHYPGDYPIAGHITGETSPVDCSKAARLLGFHPRYHWDGSELA